MVPESSHPAVLAYSARTASSVAIDFSELHPVPIFWFHDEAELISQVGLRRPVALVVAGNEDNVATIRVCYSLRRVSESPIHVISSTMSESEITLSMSLGATTVNTPQVAPSAIAQLVRRCLKLSFQPRDESQPNVLRVAGLELDLDRRRLTVRGNRVDLTRTEFQLLAMLVAAAGSVIGRDELVAKVWGPNWFGVENVLDTHLAHLRRKLSPHGLGRSIVNVRSVGFYFEPNELGTT
jgi:DNA-binding response OmpR family regulator